MGSILCLVAFVYWACTQPTEFDGLIQAQKDFIDDLYSGNLLADVPADPRTMVDRSKKVPSLEDLLRELENDEKEYITETADTTTAGEDAADAAQEDGQNQEEQDTDEADYADDAGDDVDEIGEEVSDDEEEAAADSASGEL